MTTATLTEAIYLAQGLKLHSKFLGFINGSSWSALAVLFGAVFMLTTIRYFSRFFPGSPGLKQSGLFDYVKIMFAVIIGMSILKADYAVSVKNFSQQEWARNPRFVSVKGNGNVRTSYLFYLLGGSASGIATSLEQVIDKIGGEHSQTKRPNEMIRRVVNASLAQIEDEGLRSKSHLLFDECDNIEGVELLRLDNRIAAKTKDKLRSVSFNTNQGDSYDCLSLLGEVRAGVSAEAHDKNAALHNRVSYTQTPGPYGGSLKYDPGVIGNAMLLNLLHTRQPKAELQPDSGGGMGAFFIDQFNRFFTWNADVKSNEAARKKAKEYESAERLAPHFIGFVKMILIAIFPFLVFPMVMGHWRVMIFWTLAFFSVCMWSPIWTLMHHCFAEVSQMTEYFGRAQYSALLQSEVSSEMVSMYIVFVSLQLAVAPAFSFFFLSSLKPLLAVNAANVASQEPGAKIAAGVSTAASALSYTIPAAKVSLLGSSRLKAARTGSMTRGRMAQKSALLLPGSPVYQDLRSKLPGNLKMNPNSKV